MSAAERRHLRIARRVMAALFGEPHERDFDVHYWDGTIENAHGGASDLTIVIANAGALRRMLLPASELSIVESYVSGEVDVQGDLDRAVRLADAIGASVRDPMRMARLVALLLQLPRRKHDQVRAVRFVRPEDDSSASRHGGSAAIRHHYDVGNAFYALWLDPEMQYTCAYFATGRESLAQAQLDKLELICRKLRLKPGDRLLDIGCGWGGLVRYAASRYGVIAHGITLSTAQAEYARARIAREGLTGRCTVEVRDYRELPSKTEYDKVVAVGVTEHVAADAQPAYFAAAHRVLRPGGVFLNHCEVSVNRARPRTRRQRLGDRLWRRNEFIERYVFPDARLVPAAHVIASAESVGFELRDVESLREHYALTLRHWLRGLEASEGEAQRLVGEYTYRVWRLYMATGVEGFTSGRINIIQTLLSKPDSAGRSHLPLTRDHLYQARSTEVELPERLPAA